jgi:hypothetical protein
MTLTASALDTDLHRMILLKKLFWQALPDQDSVLAAIERLQLESARPSVVYQKITENFVVDLDVLNSAIAKRVPAEV